MGFGGVEMAEQRQPTEIARRFKPKYQSKNHAIVAGLREAAGAGPPIDPHMKVKRLTAEVACAMALIHGGDWRVQVDHEIGLVVIAPRLQSSEF